MCDETEICAGDGVRPENCPERPRSASAVLTIPEISEAVPARRSDIPAWVAASFYRAVLRAGISVEEAAPVGTMLEIAYTRYCRSVDPPDASGAVLELIYGQTGDDVEIDGFDQLYVNPGENPILAVYREDNRLMRFNVDFEEFPPDVTLRMCDLLEYDPFEVFTPARLWQSAEGIFEDEENSVDGGYPSLDEFHRMYPEIFCEQSVSGTEAVSSGDETLDRLIAELDSAISAWRKNPARAIGNHICFPSMFLASVRDSDADFITRILDDDYDCRQQSGERIEPGFTAFLANDPGVLDAIRLALETHAAAIRLCRYWDRGKRAAREWESVNYREK